MTNKLLSLCCRQLAESEIIIEDKNAEIERLKLTTEERDALKEISDWNDGVSETHLAALRNLLERTKDNENFSSN